VFGSLADEYPANDQWLIEYSKLWKSMPKVVFSKTMQSADWDTTVLRDIESLVGPRERASGDLYLLGSGEVITELARHDLVDEYQIYVHPVALGGRSLPAGGCGHAPGSRFGRQSDV
jgi:dihydrofolate reductase